jgi:hypothetical protein
MAAYNKFNSWVEVMQESANVGSDQFVVALTNSAPTAANTVLADITQITYTNLSSRNLTTASSSQTSGTFKLDFNDLTLTASGGSVGPFRYVVIYDDTPTSPADPLVCWFDYGSSITLADTETLALTFNVSNGLYTAS